LIGRHDLFYVDGFPSFWYFYGKRDGSMRREIFIGYTR
jgi:hypothetical protein